jgi:hypothetical protein
MHHSAEQHRRLPSQPAGAASGQPPDGTPWAILQTRLLPALVGIQLLHLGMRHSDGSDLDVSIAPAVRCLHRGIQNICLNPDGAW